MGSKSLQDLKLGWICFMKMLVNFNMVSWVIESPSHYRFYSPTSPRYPRTLCSCSVVANCCCFKKSSVSIPLTCEGFRNLFGNRDKTSSDCTGPNPRLISMVSASGFRDSNKLSTLEQRLESDWKDRRRN